MIEANEPLSVEKDFHQLYLFDDDDIGNGSEHSWRQLNVAVPRAGVATPYLRLATVDATGRLGLSQPLSLSVVRPAPWSVDFELPASVRVGEEVVVDVHLRNGQSNCSQVGRVPSTPQRSTSGSMTFHD